MKIDLNCDMGESYGIYTLGFDALAMPLISSANVACGFHASDPGTMRRTVQLAKRHGVTIGAHPSYPDRVGFGRRAMSVTPDQIRDDVVYQVGALWALCRAEGVALGHVKPHGALYDAAARDPAVAEAMVDAVKSVGPELVLVCLSGSVTPPVARRLGLRCVQEAFADRAYAADGMLVPRSLPGAVISDPDRVADRAAAMVLEKKVVAIDGTAVPIDAETLCVHGDSPGAVELIRAIRARLSAERVRVRPFTGPGRE